MTELLVRALSLNGNEPPMNWNDSMLLLSEHIRIHEIAEFSCRRFVNPVRVSRMNAGIRLALIIWGSPAIWALHSTQQSQPYGRSAKRWARVGTLQMPVNSTLHI